MKQIVILLLLACLLTPSEQANFCSVACSTSCQGDLSTQCGTASTNCQTDGAWINSPSGTCAVKPTWVLFNSTSDYNSGTLTNTATLGGSCGDMQFYGYFTPLDSVTISANGILKPHYQVRIYVGIIAVDFDCKWGKGACGTTQNYWNGKTAYFAMDFSDPQGTETVNPTQYRALSSNRDNNLCGDSKFGEYWTRISKLYTTYNDSSALSWKIACNETNTTAKWGIREFIILYHACSVACFSCYGPSSSQCYTCYNVASDPAATTNYWQNNNTCNQTCLSRFGESSTPYTCIYCDLRCTACYNMADNCTACTTSGTWAAFLSTVDINYPTCVSPCPDGFFANKVTRTCDPCNQTCLTCLNSATYCTACASGYYWSSFFCYNPCPAGYFLDTSGLNCTKCSPFCSECYTTYVTCTTCTLSGQFKAYLTNNTAITGSCDPLCQPATYPESFGGAGPNLCLNCSTNCTLCTGFPSPCSQCASGFYLLGTECLDTCPTGYLMSNLTGTGICLNCDVVCVGLTINMYFPSVTNDKIYVDMMFTQDLDFTTFPWQTFQNITITSKNIAYTLDMFTVTYALLNTKSYRITLEPKTYIFLYNATFTVTTGPQPATIDLSIALMPFKTSNYLKTASLTWFLIKGPPFNSLETGIMNSFAKLSSNANKFLTKPFVQEFKKSGVFNLLFSGSAITSCSMLSNQIQSQNLYEGVRVFATFVFFDAPPYEQISDKTKRFVAPTVEDKIRNAQEVTIQEYEGEDSHAERLLFSTDTMYWRFQRTGQTSFFIYDVYVPMFLLAICWIALLVAHNSRGERWMASYGTHVYAAVHKIHEMSLMYITMASIVEFIYFEPTSADRFISAIICIIFSVYFAAYELYIYYDMIKYPLAEIGNKAYDYYVMRYGCFLKNVRYEEYDMNEHWSPRHWLRPYNYHLLSYYKKFVMMISLPLFYSVTYAQMGVLLFIQIIELVRFWKTWPFTSDKRNYFRLSLQFALGVFFLVNLIQIRYLQLIMSADTSTLEQLTKIFYSLGWTGFAMCLYFNISFISINVYDLCVGLRASNRSRMDEARKRYYYRKIRQYEKDNEASSKELVGRWVRMGNLNNKSYGELPEVNVRIEFYEIRKVNNKYEVSIKKITRLQMKNKAKLRKANQTTAGGKIQRKLILSPSDNSRFYSIIHDVYRRFEGPHLETLRIKTFLNVWQQKYTDGQEIPLNRDMMFQRAELISYDNDVNKQKLETLMEDFPIDETIINNAV